MKKLQVILVSVLVVILSGCASGVKRDAANSPENRVVLTPHNQVSSLSISLSDAAKAKVEDNLKFNQNALLEHLKRALDARSLLCNDQKEKKLDITVLVKDMRVRSNFTAVMFGFMAGSDSITGDVIVKDKMGQEIDRIEVSASYALGGLGGGQDATRMGWLYEEFAKQAVKALTSNNAVTTQASLSAED